MKRFALVILVVVCGVYARADVTMPKIFGDHMVLQQEKKIPVWGWAAPGEQVTVKLGAAKAKTTAGSDGTWRVNLPPVETNATPVTMTVAGKNVLTFNDVLVGDVWVCSGQSNMEFDLAGNLPPYHGFGGDSSAATVVPAANDPGLRLFIVTKKVADDPESDVKGSWMVATPQTVGNFSAVGYFFGQELRKTLKRPIGLIGTYWGGMPAQAFTSLSGLQKAPSFDKYVGVIEKVKTDYPGAKADYPQKMADFKLKHDAWVKGPGVPYMAAMKKWKDDTAAAIAAGQTPPARPVPSEPEPKQPAMPEGAPSTPTVLYNGMIAPLIPYAIKGAIWYQGEANSGNAAEYKTLFPRMITDWREKWGDGDFPFLFVQLAEFLAPQKQPAEGGWAYLREAQLDTLSVAHTGMAVAIDIGSPTDIHPKDKHDVGHRLALAADHVAYGQELVYSGPIYNSMKVEGASIRLSFKDTGSGLKMGTPPWTYDGKTPPAPAKLTGFAIAGADKQWAWGDAVIDGSTVVVSSPSVPAPVAVRYAWANFPAGNFYNNEDLPASPFRTDDWDGADSKPTMASAPASNPAPSAASAPAKP